MDELRPERIKCAALSSSALLNNRPKLMTHLSKEDMPSTRSRGSPPLRSCGLFSPLFSKAPGDCGPAITALPSRTTSFGHRSLLSLLDAANLPVMRRKVWVAISHDFTNFIRHGSFRRKKTRARRRSGRSSFYFPLPHLAATQTSPIDSTEALF